MILRSLFVSRGLLGFVIALASIEPNWAAAPTAWKWTADPAQSKVEFNSIGRPSALKIKGTGNQVNGTLELKSGKVSGSFQFGLAVLDTGIKLRNEHMKDKYLEVAKYPDARLVLSPITAPPALVSGDGEAAVKFDGTLELRGVKKPVTGTAQVKRMANELEVQADFSIKTHEYGIATPSFAGITMVEDVQITTQLKGKIQ